MWLRRWPPSQRPCCWPGTSSTTTSTASRKKIATVVKLLEPLAETDIAVYAVMGNHDYKVGAVQELTTEFERMGFGVFTDEAALVPSPGADQGPGLYVVGIGPTQVGEADPARALSGVPDEAPRLVLMHNPTTFEHLPAHSAPMNVAGHTHCGQIAIPGLPSWSYLGLNDEEEIVARGLAPEEYGAPGNDMFVTCGIGFSIVPIPVGLVALWSQDSRRTTAEQNRSVAAGRVSRVPIRRW